MSDLKQTLRENTLRLLASDGRMKSNETGISRLVTRGIGQGTAQRILEGKTSVGLETLEQLAKVLGVSPWRLIQPQRPSETPRDSTEEGASNQPSAASLEIARLLDSLPAAERAAIKTILKKLSIGAAT